MNKKLLKSFAAAAMSVLAIACAKEQVGPGEGAMVEATFSVDVPGVEVSTKGLSDAASVNELICQVFLKGAKDKNKHFVYTPVPELTQNVAVVGGKATVKFSLVKGQTYSFAFWAQTSETGYYNTDDLRSVTMNTDLVKANDPRMDAFFAIKDEARVTVSYSKKVSLKRALAQVNFGTKKYSGRSDELKAQKSYVTLTGVPNVFHPFMSGDSFACEGSETVKFNENEVISDETLSVNDAEYSYLASVYVFALNPNKTITDATAVVTLSNGKTTTIKAPNAPVKRNFKTNILGDLLTVDAMWNVDIAPEFDGGDTYDSVAANLEAGKEVTLSEDYSVADESKGVTLDVGVTSVLNLNGKKFSNENRLEENKAALQVHGDLTINGDGEVYCEGGADNNAIIVEQGGHLVINGGTYNVGANTNSGKSNATIFVMGPDKYGRNGSVEINGGVFMAKAGSGSDATPFVLNQHDDITVNCFSVKGGTFVGFNPASVNEANGAITSFVADGYKSVETTYNGKPAWKVVDASVSVADQAEFEKTLSDLSGTDDVIIKLGTGNFEFKKSGYAGNITLKGAGIGKTVVTSNTFYENKGVTISLENLTFDSKNPYVSDAQLCQFLRSDIAFTNCEINGVVGVMAQKSATFTGCTFKNSTNSGFTGYSIIYYGYDNSTITVDDCKFETTGKAICLYGTAGIYNLVVKDCEFLTSNKDKAAIQIHTDYTNGDAASTLMRGNVNITNTTVSGFNGIWWEGLNDKTPKVPTKYFTITIDGTTVQTAE